MAPTYSVFVGIFVQLPQDKPTTLAIRKGAIWVSLDDGRIKGTDWNVMNEDDIQSLLRERGWVPEGAAPWRSGTRVKIIRAREEQNEFFFPGFIGRALLDTIFMEQLLK